MAGIPHLEEKLLAKFLDLCAKWATCHAHTQICPENFVFLNLVKSSHDGTH